METGPPFTYSSEPREGLAVWRTKEVPSFLSYFKTLSIGPAPGIEPATSRSAVKRSTDWAKPAAKKRFQFTCFNWEGSEICKLYLICDCIYLKLLKLIFKDLNKLSFSYAEFRLTSERRNHAGNLLWILFALEKFQCLFEMISESFYLCNLCMFMWVLISYLLDENDINIFVIIESRHFHTLNYISNRRSLINELFTISVYFLNIWILTFTLLKHVVYPFVHYTK